MRLLAEALPACYRPGIFEAGTDEAGRGCLAGPVVAAAVILPDDYHDRRLNDSKKISERNRLLLRDSIVQNAIAWSVGVCSPAEIDSMNILNASIEAMHRALNGLTPKPGAVSVDGNRFKPWGDVECLTFVKGDARFANIAAASIIAKTHRDALMEELDAAYPQYGWAINKAYPTQAHRDAIRLHGPSPHHRMSFKLI